MGFFKRDELRFLWPFYLDAIISPMLFFSPAFFVPYFISVGFSATQIGMLIAMAPLFALLFEVPTGAVADLYGRKTSVLLGFFIEGLGFLSIFFFDNYYFILGSFAIIGFGSTFSSGSKEAWITDLIKGKKKDLLHDYFVKVQSFDSFGLIFSGFLGATIVLAFGLKSIWIFAALSFAISISILLFSQENYKKQKLHIKESYKKLSKQTKKSIAYSRKHPVLFYFFLANFIIIFGAAFNEGLSWAPFLQELGFPDYAFGYLWSALGAVFMISPWISKKFLKKDRERSFIITVVLISMGITSFVLFADSLIFALPITVLGLFFYSARNPVERIYFHKFVPSNLRATVGSVESMIMSIAYIIAIPLVGFAVDKIGPRYTIFLSVLIMIPGIIIYSKINEKN